MDELLSMSYESVIAPGDLGETKKQFQKVLKGNTALLEMSVITKNSKKKSI